MSEKVKSDITLGRRLNVLIAQHGVLKVAMALGHSDTVKLKRWVSGGVPYHQSKVVSLAVEMLEEKGEL